MTTCISCSAFRLSVLQPMYWYLVVITDLLLVQGTTPAAINCNTCPHGTYLEKPCDGKVDTVCKPCPQGTYNHNADLYQSCGECSYCEMTQIVTQECTPTSDTVCGCPERMVWESFGADGMCSTIINCQKCPNGTYVEKPCDSKVDTVCKPCPQGTYNHNADISQSCGECTTCEMTQIVIQECTPRTDTVCGCPERMVWESFGADGMCSTINDCKKCPNGTYVEKPCDGTMDTMCKPCPKGTYNHNADLSQSCGECSYCEVTQIVISVCSPTTDTVCGCPQGMRFGADGMCSMVIQKQHHDKSHNPPISSGCKIYFTLSLGLLLLILYAVDWNM